MNNASEIPLFEPPAVVIKLKSSTQRGGAEGYEITVTNMASDEAVEATIKRAIAGREKLLRELRKLPENG